MASSTVNTEQFKRAMGTLPTGVTVITTVCDNKKYGFTASSVISVSLSPLLILFCINRNSFSTQAFIDSKYFAVNILSENQQHLAAHFAVSNLDKFIGVSYNLGQYSKCPLIEEAVCYIECNKCDCYKAGDHWIIIGEVINSTINNNLNPLIRYLKEYRKLQ
jgi:flavin reductase (DIM6/NTAB) family NADH-FMN oxidoreductase RutF